MLVVVDDFFGFVIVIKYMILFIFYVYDVIIFCLVDLFFFPANIFWILGNKLVYVSEKYCN